jgi:hypothetical protein
MGCARRTNLAGFSDSQGPRRSATFRTAYIFWGGWGAEAAPKQKTDAGAMPALAAKQGRP